jgi:hypothetical protein
MRVTNAIPLGSPILTVTTINHVETLKVSTFALELTVPALQALHTVGSERGDDGIQEVVAASLQSATVCFLKQGWFNQRGYGARFPAGLCCSPVALIPTPARLKQP